jgi:hypothetical protein
MPTKPRISIKAPSADKFLRLGFRARHPSVAPRNDQAAHVNGFMELLHYSAFRSW